MQSISPKPSSKKIIVRSIVVLIIVAAGITILYIRQATKLTAETHDRLDKLKDGPVVKIATASLKTGGKDLIFVGEALPFQNVTLYAKISGYIDKILVDKGDKVSEGQLLATIISPEVDQSYKSAQADLENKKSILNRDQTLLKKEYISQEVEEQAETDVTMAEANVKSLSEQQGYKYITAPFSGTVTARYADPGSLVQNATSSQTSALPVVTVAQLNKLRIYIYVEQKDANDIKPGCPVDITLTEDPKFDLKTTVTRTTGQLDEQTRMMTTEIDVDNTKDLITPGSYVQVHVHVSASVKLQVPSEALVVRVTKYYLAVVDDSNQIHYKEIQVGENNGQNITVLSGIKEGDKIALNLGESLADGQKVRIEK